MLRFATGIASWLPGVSAGARLGLEGRTTATARVAETAAKPAPDRSDDRLPTRDDAFYWSLMHSHL